MDAASGKAVWTFKTQSEIKSSPVVAGDRVLIGSYDSSLYALGAKDGEPYADIFPVAAALGVTF